jgi:hypothetical protein
VIRSRRSFARWENRRVVYERICREPFFHEQETPKRPFRSDRSSLSTSRASPGGEIGEIQHIFLVSKSQTTTDARRREQRTPGTAVRARGGEVRASPSAHRAARRTRREANRARSLRLARR